MKGLIVIKTSSIDYDERLKKEIISLRKNKDIYIDLFSIEDFKSNIVFEHLNIYNPKFIFNNFKNSYLKIITLLELYIRLKFKFQLRNYDFIWFHDPIMMFIIPFIAHKNIIWDLHELPPEFVLNNKLLNFFFNKSIHKVNKVIVANKERGDYLKETFKNLNFFVLQNFPPKSNNIEVNYRDVVFEKWQHKDNFAYCQSATHPTRNFESLAQACVEAKMPLLVIGDKNEVFQKTKSSIENFDKYILVLGKKPSSVLPYYFRFSKFSFVFYTNQNMNNYLCAPNRLYHSLNNGLPVIVGKNPTMANVVKNYNCGIVIPSFGENPNDIVAAIEKINLNYDFYKFNSINLKNFFIWESQENVIKNLIFN